MRGELDIMDGIRWGSQAADDAMDWIVGVKRVPPKQAEPYRAGFEAGWRQAISTLKLQGVIKTYDKKGRNIYTGRQESGKIYS